MLNASFFNLLNSILFNLLKFHIDLFIKPLYNMLNNIERKVEKVTLGELVKNYRTEHELSLRDFSKISGVSNGYISMLEKNEHPKTKKPIVPSIEKMKCIASAMGMTLDSLLEIIDEDQPVSISKDRSSASPSLSVPETELIMKYRRLNSDGKKRLCERADELLDLGYVEKGDAEKMA